MEVIVSLIATSRDTSGSNGPALYKGVGSAHQVAFLLSETSHSCLICVAQPVGL